MSSLKTFFSHLGHELADPKTAQEAQLAGTVLSAFNPGLGNLVETVAGAVYAVEQTASSSATSASKQAEAKAIIAAASPAASAILGEVTGKPAPSNVEPEIDKLIDVVVDLFNALKIFGHKGAAVKPAA